MENYYPKTRGQWKVAKENPCCHAVPGGGFTVDSCSVCLDPILKEWEILPCGHHFHRDCLKKWSKSAKKLSCPLCRSDYMVLDGIMQTFDPEKFGTMAFQSVLNRPNIYGILYSEARNGLFSKFFWSLQLNSSGLDVSRLCFYFASEDGSCNTNRGIVVYEDGAYLDNYWEALEFACPGLRLGLDKFWSLLYD